MVPGLYYEEPRAALTWVEATLLPVAPRGPQDRPMVLPESENMCRPDMVAAALFCLGSRLEMLRRIRAAAVGAGATPAQLELRFDLVRDVRRLLVNFPPSSRTVVGPSPINYAPCILCFQRPSAIPHDSPDGRIKVTEVPCGRRLRRRSAWPWWWRWCLW
jgi:hypothetical protein